MRLPEAAIKAAILRPEEEVRVTAASYFSKSFSQDEAIMPLVVQCVEKYGRSTALRILRDSQRLPQTQATVDWLVNELRRDYDLEDLDDDNYRFAVALILYQARPELLLERHKEIAALSMFPDPLRGPLDERLDMLSWDWDRGWAALQAHGRDTMRRGSFTHNEVRYAHRIIESLARHRAAKAGFVFDLLQPRDEGRSEPLMRWLEPLIVNLAGVMRLESAVPPLIKRLSAEDVRVSDQSATALIRIDTDVAVHAIADEWRDADSDFRGAASDVLEHVHTDLCAESCLRFFAVERDAVTRLSLAHAVLSQLIEEGVEPVRQLVLGDGGEVTPNGLDIRYRLVVACTMMGVLFPEYAKWHEDALANHWGLGDYVPPRLADDFRPDRPEPKTSGDGKRPR